MLLVKTPDTRL